jgi:anti-sigma-K factor RskA
MTDPNEDETDLLAAELSLSLLSGAEETAARARARTDGRFAHRLARWTARLSPLFDEVDPVTPPEDLWSRIERQTRARAPANDNGLRKGLNRWRVFAGGMTAVAAALAIMLLTRPVAPVKPGPPTAASSPLVASLSNDEQRLVLVASFDPNNQRIVIGAGGLGPPTGHSHEVWVIPADGKPRSIGLLSPRPEAAIGVRRDVAELIKAGATMAVSLEPAGGSPTGAPTGPVIASGPLHRI